MFGALLLNAIGTPFVQYWQVSFLSFAGKRSRILPSYCSFDDSGKGRSSDNVNAHRIELGGKIADDTKNRGGSVIALVGRAIAPCTVYQTSCSTRHGISKVLPNDRSTSISHQFYSGMTSLVIGIAQNGGSLTHSWSHGI